MGLGHGLERYLHSAFSEKNSHYGHETLLFFRQTIFGEPALTEIASHSQKRERMTLITSSIAKRHQAGHRVVTQRLLVQKEG